MPLCRLHSEVFPKLPACCLDYHNSGYHYSHKFTRFPRPDVDPRYRAVAKLLMCPQPVNYTRQNARKHHVQWNGVKQEDNIQPQLKLISGFGIRRQYGTNQNLIARPSNSYNDPTGCQHESLTWFFHELVAPTQLNRIYEARDFNQHWTQWIHIFRRNRNQDLPKNIFSVLDYKGASIIFSCCPSSSSLRSGLLSKSNTRQPGVSRRSR